LMDEMVTVGGLKIYGSPWQPRFFDWAFNVNRGEDIAKKWVPIPTDLDILITHGPAYGILDYTYTGQRVGCEELYKKIMEVQPVIHVCGHIHYAFGYKEFNNTNFFNASSLGEDYQYHNKPIVVDYDEVSRKIEDIYVEGITG
jgi:Icc-related predicted phosphoesterase